MALKKKPTKNQPLLLARSPDESRNPGFWILRKEMERDRI